MLCVLCCVYVCVVGQGISKKALEYKGYGATVPLVLGNSPANQRACLQWWLVLDRWVACAIWDRNGARNVEQCALGASVGAVCAPQVEISVSKVWLTGGASA